MQRVRLLANGKVDGRQFNRGGPPINKNGGRPVGSKNKFPIGLRGEAAKAHVAAGGVMPLDFMMAILRGNKVCGGTGKDKWEFPVSWEDKKWAAERLLHCFTPKLTNTSLSGTVKVLALPPEALKGMSDDELTVMEKALGKLAGDLPLNGNGSNGHDTISAEAYAEILGEE